MSTAAGKSARLVDGGLDPVLAAVEAGGTVERVRQRLFRFEPGSEDKVYEIDLVKVDAEHFLVNFRFGRGELVERELVGTLSKGSKTILPVGNEEAERIFSELVQSRLDRGWVDWDVSEIETKELPQEPGSEEPATPEEPLPEELLPEQQLPEEDMEATVSMDMPIPELSFDETETEELDAAELKALLAQDEAGMAVEEPVAQGDDVQDKKPWWKFW